MKRLAIVGTVAMFALALLPATARARLIGPTLPLSYDQSVKAHGVTGMTTSMTAPFSGKIKRFQVQGIRGAVRLQVIGGSGRYKALRQGHRKDAHLNPDQVATFKANIPVRKGNHIGLRFGWGGPFGLHTTGFTGPSSDWFDPALKVGGSPRSVTYDDQSELLFNAMLKR
jgi:hypothetical protein